MPEIAYTKINVAGKRKLPPNLVKPPFFSLLEKRMSKRARTQTHTVTHTYIYLYIKRKINRYRYINFLYTKIYGYECL